MQTFWFYLHKTKCSFPLLFGSLDKREMQRSERKLVSPQNIRDFSCMSEPEREDPTFSFASRRQLILCRCNRDTGSDLSAEPSWSCKLVEGTGVCCCLALVRPSWPFMKIRTASALLVCWHATFTGQTCFFWDSLVVWGLSTHSEQWQQQLYRHTELAHAA